MGIEGICFMGALFVLCVTIAHIVADGKNQSTDMFLVEVVGGGCVFFIIAVIVLAVILAILTS